MLWIVSIARVISGALPYEPGVTFTSAAQTNLKPSALTLQFNTLQEKGLHPTLVLGVPTKWVGTARGLIRADETDSRKPTRGRSPNDIV